MFRWFTSRSTTTVCEKCGTGCGAACRAEAHLRRVHEQATAARWGQL